MQNTLPKKIRGFHPSLKLSLECIPNECRMCCLRGARLTEEEYKLISEHMPLIRAFMEEKLSELPLSKLIIPIPKEYQAKYATDNQPTGIVFKYWFDARKRKGLKLGRCPFINSKDWSCAIHKVAWALKPIDCKRAPIYVKNGILRVRIRKKCNLKKKGKPIYEQFAWYLQRLGVYKRCKTYFEGRENEG